MGDDLSAEELAKKELEVAEQGKPDHFKIMEPELDAEDAKSRFL
jgi:hypothetical protein